jgi:DNA invertase Pin-like site-specific DNA recombinase
LAEFERDLIRERTQAGLTAARARGKAGGRQASASWRRTYCWPTSRRATTQAR